MCVYYMCERRKEREREKYVVFEEIKKRVKNASCRPGAKYSPLDNFLRRVLAE